MPAATKSPSGAPERSLTQRMDALNEANRVRTKRAQLKKDLRAGRANINVLLLSPPDYIQSAKVSDMLLAVPKYGQRKVNRVLAQGRISPSETIVCLSQRQRAELVSRCRK